MRSVAAPTVALVPAVAYLLGGITDRAHAIRCLGAYEAAPRPRLAAIASPLDGLP